MILKSKIPTLYHSLFPELLDIEFPAEVIATCESCTLCSSVQSPYVTTKCCAYHPHLANYLLGAILTDEDKSLELGKERVRAQITARIGVTPYGIIPSVPYSNLEKIKESQEFWKRPHDLIESLRCPYYNSGHCTIWKYRENLCVTHFCSSVGGSEGKVFWKKVNKYLKMAETTLSQYAMVQLGWPSSKIKTEKVTTADFNIEDEQGIVNDQNYIKLWGEWVGREEEFYKKCYETVRKMDALSFKKITGLNREILDLAIRDTQKNFTLNILPEYLKLHPDIVFNGTKEGYTRVTLGENSAEIPFMMGSIIRGFNGNRKTTEVFRLGYHVLINLSELVDELRTKGILVQA